MNSHDEALIEASIHYSITQDGDLARISTPYKMRCSTKMGVGFDFFDCGYMKFRHRVKKGSPQFSIRTHRMVFYLHHGHLPEFIDHIDRDTRNNKISNLREATRAQNNSNKESLKGSTSKYLGVYKGTRKKGRWEAQISNNYKKIFLGRFKTEVEAAIAYNKAAIKHHGDFANLNEI